MQRGRSLHHCHIDSKMYKNMLHKVPKKTHYKAHFSLTIYFPIFLQCWKFVLQFWYLYTARLRTKSFLPGERTVIHLPNLQVKKCLAFSQCLGSWSWLAARHSASHSLILPPQHGSGEKIRWKSTRVEVRTVWSLTNYCHGENRLKDDKFNSLPI